ncbi:MAG: hypothetical protein ACP5OE_09915 [Thermodesulfobium sp.]
MIRIATTTAEELRKLLIDTDTELNLKDIEAYYIGRLDVYFSWKTKKVIFIWKDDKIDTLLEEFNRFNLL